MTGLVVLLVIVCIALLWWVVAEHRRYMELVQVNTPKRTPYPSGNNSCPRCSDLLDENTRLIARARQAQADKLEAEHALDEMKTAVKNWRTR